MKTFFFGQEKSKMSVWELWAYFMNIVRHFCYILWLQFGQSSISLDKCSFQFTWLLVELIAFCCQLNRFYSLITLLLYCTNPNGFPGSLLARQQQWSAVFRLLISPSSLANSFWLLTAADLPDFLFSFVREIGTFNRISALNWKCNKWEKFIE